MMTVDAIKQAITGEWVSIAPEVRPSASKNADGTLKPFYLTRHFKYNADDTFELEVINYVDAYGKIPLAKMNIKGHIVWQGEHPIAQAAQKVDFIADKAYQITPLNQGFADVLNHYASSSYDKWEVNNSQSIYKKAFAVFGLSEGQIFSEYDLIYTLNGLLFWGARNIDGRGFDTETNRPTNLQIPLIRKE